MSFRSRDLIVSLAQGQGDEGKEIMTPCCACGTTGTPPPQTTACPTVNCDKDKDKDKDKDRDKRQALGLLRQQLRQSLSQAPEA